jgi:exopolysaccharide production protein ExoY
MTPTARTAPSSTRAIRPVHVARHVPPAHRPAKSLYSERLKRWFDLAFSLLSLPVVIPLGLVVAIFIKIDSHGPVLVKLNRLGKEGGSFGQYKFRTMIIDAERRLQQLLESDPEIREEFEATYKIKNDPRITRIGRWLRKTSLDELPQVINVLKGEMTWVGPRAIRPDELKMYGDNASVFLSAVPGITGLWQVSGRSKLSYEERVHLDVHYIETVSFLNDIHIILRTVPVMFTGNGAF